MLLVALVARVPDVPDLTSEIEKVCRLQAVPLYSEPGPAKLGDKWLAGCKKIRAQLRQEQGLNGDDIRVLLLNQNTVPTESALISLKAAITTPAILCCAEVQNDTDVRWQYDWWQTDAPNAQHRQLAYSENSPSAYGDIGAMCLPINQLITAASRIPENRRSYNNGANMLLVADARYGLPVKLLQEAVIRVYTEQPKTAAPVPATISVAVSASAASAPIAAPVLGAKLHVGCGSKHLRGWLNTDMVPGIGPDGVVDLYQLETQPANTYAAIYVCHALEHVWPEKTLPILQQLHRMLLPGGIIRISVPDIRLIVANCVDSNKFGPDANAPLFGDYYEHAASPNRHRQAFWHERLEQLLATAGFLAIRTWTPDQYPEIAEVCDWSSYATISLNLEANKPPLPAPPAEPLPIPTITPITIETLPMPEAEATTIDMDTLLAGIDPNALFCDEHKAYSTIDVSIILGTVNRPKMLRECIECVRNSLRGSSYTYEIIVAYGSEKDKSLKWMQQQPDIRPILGGLDGAIPAFNLAYKASKGRYVCQINDDVKIQETAIANALRHLDTDPTLGAIVFYMSRDGGKTYPPINYQDAGGLPHPNQVIARRELCEDIIAAGMGEFWGDAAHRTHKTYAGDSSWGLWASRLGWRIERSEDVKLIDRMDETQDDEQRKKNIEGYAEHIKLWYERHPKGFHTPIIREPLLWPNIYNPERGKLPRRSPIAAGPPERVLHIALSWLPKEPQPDLHRQLARLGPYRTIRWIERLHQAGADKVYHEAIELVKEHQPALIWMQIQRDHWFDSAVIRQMREVAPRDCLIISWTGDVRTDVDAPVEPWMVDHCQAVDLFLSSECTYAEKLVRENSVPARTGHLICGGDVLENAPRKGDPAQWAGAGRAVFVGSKHAGYDNANRVSIMQAVTTALPEWLVCYGSDWNDATGIKSGRFISKPERAQLHDVARIAVIQSLFTKLRRYTSDRMQGSLLTGACCAIQAFDDYEGYGLKDGENCLIWRDTQDLIELLKDWLRPERDAARQPIRHAGCKLAHETMSWEVTMENMLAIVRAERRRRTIEGKPGGILC